MNILFADTLKKLRIERGLSQRELAERLCVNRTTVTRWENGSRLPDAVMIFQLFKCLGVDIGTLIHTIIQRDEPLNVIMLDNRKFTLLKSLPILKQAMPNATIKGFTLPYEAIEYAKANLVSLVFLDVELGKISGFDVCRTLLEINPHTNVVYVTAHVKYAYDAWSTGARGFMLKPLTQESVQAQLKNLRFPFLSSLYCINSLPL